MEQSDMAPDAEGKSDPAQGDEESEIDDDVVPLFIPKIDFDSPPDVPLAPAGKKWGLFSI